MKYRNDLKKRVLAGLFAGAALCLAAPAALAASSPVANNQLPVGGNVAAGTVDLGILGQGKNPNGATSATITQSSQNAVITWDSFNIGANATVNFEGPQGGYNTLNYDKGGSMSQIYGKINANNNGNIYIVNPAGVEIGNSAQINVGSLYVSNKKLDNELENIENKDNPNIGTIMSHGTIGDAVLMSLGNINANTVTFEGNRIVIDTERIKDESGDIKLVDIDNGQNITIRTTNENNVVIGYKGYDEDNNAYNTQDVSYNVTKINDDGSTTAKTVKGYMWVEDVEQLQAIGASADTLDGNYALRNSIDATATRDWNDTGTSTDVKEGFQSIGALGNEFTGKFDGLDYNIFNLNIKKDTDNVGLFGVVGEGAVINNVTLVGGSITGQNNVGALAGSVQGGAQISNITNSASVTGKYNVGGIVGESKGAAFIGLVNTGTIEAENSTDASNAGGLIGSMNGGTLGGASYNLGSVTGEGHNVGGLVGHAYASKLGDGTNLIYNRLNVSGAYNVGGIVGSMTNTTVQNAENSGNVTATGHTTETYKYHSAKWTSQDSITKETVNIANAGGIAGMASGGSKISDVQNSGDVSSGMDTKDNGGYTFYTAGNVGGIVGRAEDTNITDATNTENDVRGAHNVGGIAGYFGSTDTENTDVTYTITRGVNNGGDILATGAVDKNTKESTTSNELTRKDGFITEYVRGGSKGSEQSIIGNIGGIAGYMYGDNVYIASSANRGTVHSQDISTEKVLPVSQAANAGGIVGKIDRSETLKRGDGQSWEAALTSEGSSTKYDKAAVSNSYSTGDVRGYMGVGGIAGMMYNGEIAGSYNLGTVNTTRNQDSFKQGNYFAVNMGGIVGDTTEETDARAVLYDVYNKGQIGDETFTYYARHVGGIVGRLSGAVEKAYNTGAIYNGYSIVGGIVGWLNAGSVTNSFNTGNITVWNHDSTEKSNVGGIAGDVNIATGDIVLTNVYNLGTLRSINAIGGKGSILGGIVGAIHSYHGTGNSGALKISNAYTTGNLYSDDTIKSIVGSGSATLTTLTNTYYIYPANKEVFTLLSDNQAIQIKFDDKDDADSYDGFTFTSQSSGTITGSGDWRIYDGSTPILNAFLPNTEKYFSGETGVTNAMDGIASIQYGTAYDPLLTIVKANGQKDNLDFDWQKLGINNDAGLAVYGAGLTLNDFMSTGGSGYFGGLIYSDGALTLNAHTDGDTHNPENKNVTGDVALGSASQLYGSSVAIDAAGQVTIYGSVTATGNEKDGTGNNYVITDEQRGNISITGGSVDIYGQLTSAKGGETVRVPGISGMAEGWSPTDGHEDVENPEAHPEIPMSDIGDRFGYTTGESAATGSISITANDTEDGHVNVHYGNKGEGIVTTGGDLTVTASGDIYMDSDLDVGGNITFDAPGEKVLDLTNIGKVRGESFMADITAALQQAGIVISNPDEVKNKKDAAISAIMDILSEKYEMGEDSAKTMANSIVGTLMPEGEGVDGLAEQVNVNRLHEFLDHFQKPADGTNGFKLTFKNGENGSAADSSKITVDMWDEEINKGKGGFNLDKFDREGDKFVDDLNNLKLTVNGDTEANTQKYTYIWVSTGEQLKGIQQYKNTHSGSNILTYNFALKNDINASGVTDYEAIGTNSQNGYTGTFDGRDNRIIGLDTTKTSNGSSQTLTNAGIFDTIGTREDGEGKIHTGTVEDLRVYSGTFTGTDNAGAVAGVNNGSISNVTAFGNVVQSEGYAGGITGENTGTIDNASAIGTATAANAEDESRTPATAGGIAGINQNGAEIKNSTSNSAVNASKGNAAALGGVAGVNAGKLDNVDSLGVTTGLYKLEGHNSTKENQYSDNVGGIAGTNSGTVTNVYNESIVSGRNNVGGILGENSGKNVSNVANASNVTGEAGNGAASNFVGGLVSDNEGSITNGRNNGKITGNNYVGGLVGANGKDSTLTNLVNDESAAIIGDNYVGGIAGTNEGTISAENQDNLINRGTITGQKYVGGVAGENIGTIEYIKNDIDLIVRDPLQEAMYFGGVAGVNGRVNQDGSVIKDKDGNVLYKGTITSATNQANIVAPKADYVGGIVGWNTAAGDLEGMGNSNEGRVEGASHVGGVAGKNDADIAGTVASMVGIENSGVVIAHNGGAGGIFGENNGNIEYVEMTNKGIVSGSDSKDENGTDGTGGIFGVNKGNVIHSSLKNEIGGQVMGTQNVGGLIGMNTGDITGGRTDKTEDEQNVDNGYYKYQIYNNGTINAGTWTDKNQNGIVDKGELDAAKPNSQNIAGLFGINRGKVTAGYNTGAIHADGSKNVGGIAGTNEGTLDQVFNTVMDADGTAGNITGSTNVGGIAGTNTGTISNAYNTTAVTGTTDVGSIAGTNSNTADDSISNIYSTIGDKLVGYGKEATHVYNSENGFGEGGSSIHKDGEEAAENDLWRQYGNNNPILKVFLTQLTVNETVVIDGKEVSLNDYLNLVYNGKEQDINIQDLIDKGFITGPDGMKHKDDNGQDVSFVFDAHKNTSKNDDFGNSQLIYNTVGQQNVGKYTGWLASAQIAASGQGSTFNPNNLGYDIDLPLSIGLPSEYPGVVEPPVDEHWNFLFDDNPWDRNRDFRERKAEVHFVAGGMTL